MGVLSIKTFRTIFLFSIFCFYFSFSQNDPKKQIEDIFKQTSKIEIYAYLVNHHWEREDRRSSQALVYNNIVNIPEKYLRNKIILTKGQIKKLKKQLLLSDEKINERATCFDPRHAIVFYDKNNSILGYVNICFSCIQAESSSNFNVLTNRFLFQCELFKEFGIAYFMETKEEIDAYNTRIIEELLERDKKFEEYKKLKTNHH
jgi:hypothetical protein